MELSMDQISGIDSTYGLLGPTRSSPETTKTPIHDFSIVSADGTDRDVGCAEHGPVFLLVAYDLRNPMKDAQNRIPTIFVALSQKQAWGSSELTSSAPAS